MTYMDLLLSRNTLSEAVSPAEGQTLGEMYPTVSGNDLPPAIPPQHLTAMSTWESSAVRPLPPVASGDDDFMSWDGVARETWPRFHKC